MPKAKGVTIPISRLQEGIQSALERARYLLEDALALADKERGLGTAVLFSHGVEEIGKAGLLREALGKPRAKRQSVTIIGFRDHPTKLRKATEILPPGTCMVFEAGFDADEFFDAEKFFGGNAVDDLDTRTAWLYVDWNEAGRRWIPEPKIETSALRYKIQSVLDWVAEKQRAWCP